MHPSLARHLHGEECREIIEQLHSCHANHPYKKFFGACNDLKRALNRCLQKEYEVRRKQSYQASVERKRRYKELLQEEEDDS